MRLKWHEVGPAALLALMLQYFVPFLFCVFGVSVGYVVFVVVASLPYSLVRSIWMLKPTFEIPPGSPWPYLLNECFYTAAVVFVIRATRFFAAKPRKSPAAPA